MAFNWDDPNAVTTARQKAIQAGYKSADVDKFIGEQQKQSATVKLAQQKQLDPSVYQGLQKDNPQLALKIASAGAAPDPAKSAQEKAHQDTLNETKNAAQAVIDIMDKGQQGKLTGKAYHDALLYAVGKYTSAGAFGAGGKNLTANELAQLAGTQPVLEQKTGNLFDKAKAFVTGNKVPQTGEIVDDPATVRNKMLLALGKDPINTPQAGQNQMQPTQGGGIMQNAGNDVKGMLNGLLNLPAQGMELGKRAAGGDNQALQQIMANANLVNVGMRMGKGMLQEANDVAGHPLEGGDIVGRILQHAQQHPVNTALDVLPFLPKGGKAVAALEDTNAAKMPIQDTMRQNVRGIDAGASVYGASKEQKINNTLDQLGIKGSAGEQYAQLQPKIAQIGDQIQAHLDKNAVPVPVEQVKKDFMANLNDELLSKNISAPAAKKEINGLLQDVYGGNLGSDISTADIFKLKQKLNGSYGKIQDKLESRTPLTDREQVIRVARKTVDDIISEKHPDVKTSTLQQSDLYSAADSLHKSRNAKGVGLNILGNRLPLVSGNKLQQGLDFLGRVGQKEVQAGNDAKNFTTSQLQKILPFIQAGRMTSQQQ